MLRLGSISKDYAGEGIFNELSLNINSGLTRLIGKNGSGKSTLLRIIAGKEEYKGKIYLDDRPFNRRNRENNIILVNHDITLLENKTVEGNLKALDIKSIYNSELSFFHISEIINKKVNELSGGEKKRVALYIAFLLEPKILLLDEYSNYLDNEIIPALNAYIIKYSLSNYVIYVDHKEDIGGDIIDLDNMLASNMAQENIEIGIKHKLRISLYYLKECFRPLNIMAMLMFVLMLSSFLISGSYSRLNMNYPLYDYYNKMGLSYFLYNPNKEIDKELGSYYYLKELSANDRFDMNLGIYTITYYESLGFPLKDALDCDSPKAYVFDYSDNARLLGNIVEIDNISYKIAGVIDYDTSLSQGIDNNLFNTILIEGKTSSYDYIGLRVSKDELKTAIMSGAFGGDDYIKHDIESKLNRELFKALAIASLCILIAIIVLTELFGYKKGKADEIYLREYSYSKEDLLSTALIGNFIKLVPITLISYLFSNFIIRKYQEVLIAPFSVSFKIDNMALLFGVMILIIALLIINIFIYMLDINNRK